MYVLSDEVLCGSVFTMAEDYFHVTQQSLGPEGPLANDILYAVTMESRPLAADFEICVCFVVGGKRH